MALKDEDHGKKYAPAYRGITGKAFALVPGTGGCFIKGIPNGGNCAHHQIITKGGGGKRNSCRRTRTMGKKKKKQKLALTRTKIILEGGVTHRLDSCPHGPKEKKDTKRRHVLRRSLTEKSVK